MLGSTSGSLFTVALPKLLCPVCWPAYAGVISSLGLTSMLNTAWLIPLTIITLVLILGTLGFRAGTRRGFSPFILGMLGASVLLVGEFIMKVMPLMYTGGALLIAASIWNGWPRKKDALSGCPACTKS